MSDLKESNGSTIISARKRKSMSPGEDGADVPKRVATRFEHSCQNSTEKFNSSATDSTLPLTSIVRLTIRAASSALLQLPKAFDNLSSSLSTGDDSVSNVYLNNFDSAAFKIRDFVRFLPGFQHVPMSDRCLLFAESAVPIFVTQMCFLNQSQFAFFGMTANQKIEFIENFPEFMSLSDEISQIAEAVNSWNPSIAEWSLFQAIFFFRDPSKLSRPLENPHLIYRLHSSYKRALLDLLANKLNDNFSLRLRHFARVYDLLQAFSYSHAQLAPLVCCQPRRCPSLGHPPTVARVVQSVKENATPSPPPLSRADASPNDVNKVVHATGYSNNKSSSSSSSSPFKSAFFHEMFCHHHSSSNGRAAVH